MQTSQACDAHACTRRWGGVTIVDSLLYRIAGIFLGLQFLPMREFEVLCVVCIQQAVIARYMYGTCTGRDHNLKEYEDKQISQSHPNP